MSIKALENHLKPLTPLLIMDGVTEICINRPKEIFVEKNSCFSRYDIEVLSCDHLESLAALVAEFNHQEISPEKPLLSATLPTGERVQFVLSPACEKNHVVCSIRRHQMRDLEIDDYVKAGAFDEITENPLTQNNGFLDTELKALYKKREWVSFLKTAIKAKKNIIISGGTGTGKTTFLNACLKLIHQTERLITIEDTREVCVNQPNSAHLIASKGQQGISKIRMQDLFECCLRLRPDRIFLSELWGEEAFAFLRAANSGHPGSLSTIHADTPQGAFEQLVFMMQQAGSTSSDERILQYIKSIIPIVIQLKRSPTPTIKKINSPSQRPYLIQ
jgi:type IV secretion system protein VirB11